MRAHDRGRPTYEGLRAEHGNYVSALRSAGVEITELPPLEEFPDSLFVEDAALVFSEGAIRLRPGAPSRLGEAQRIAPVLDGMFDVLLDLPSGYVDGGDVLVTPLGVIIGLSGRTNRDGAEALAACLQKLGRQATIVEPPKGVLHLKSACSLLDGETMLCTPGLAGTGMFDGFRQVLTAEGEDAAANALRINDVVLAAAGFPKTIERLDSLGYSVVPLETSDIGKLDAGLSCMSLRWWDPASG